MRLWRRRGHRDRRLPPHLPLRFESDAAPSSSLIAASARRVPRLQQFEYRTVSGVAGPLVILDKVKVVTSFDHQTMLIYFVRCPYKSKVALYFEGFQYQLGDFRLRVGKVVPTHSENVRGIVMEVEYLPISSMEKATKVMEEFLEIWHEDLSKRSLPGKFVNIELNFGEFGLGDSYTPQHTAVRYALVMTHMIARVQAVRG